MKIGRNEPCPCGSGKKYKKCCLGKEKSFMKQNNKIKVIHRWMKDSFLVSKSQILIDAINNGLFDEYSENHLFFQESEFSINMIYNLFTKISSLENIFSKKEIENIIKDKLSAGKDNYNEETLLQVLSELEIFFYYFIWQKTLLSDIKYEPKLNHEKNPEISFKYKWKDIENIIEIEVKTPVPFKGNIEPGTWIVNYRRGNKSDLNCLDKKIFPPDTKIKDYLISAEEKLSKGTIEVNRHFGFLCIHWQDFWVDRIPLFFFNKYSGIFTENSFIKDKLGNNRKFEKICGVIIYKTLSDAIYGDNLQFMNYKCSKKWFIKNPYSKNIEEELIRDLFSPDIKIINKEDFEREPEVDGIQLVPYIL